MNIDAKDYLPIAAALASVAGALSAIAFAFFLASSAERERLDQELSIARRRFKQMMSVLNEHLKAQDGTISIAQDIEDPDVFDKTFLAALRDVIEKINSRLTPIFDRFAFASIENATRHLVEASSEDRNRIDALMSFVRGEYRSDANDQLTKINALTSASERMAANERTLLNLSALSGLSVLVLCAAAMPPIGWNIYHFSLYLGTRRLFAFYAGFIVDACSRSIEFSGGGGQKTKNIPWYLLYVIVLLIAYYVFLARSFEW